MLNNKEEFITLKEVRGFSDTFSLIVDVLRQEFKSLWKALMSNCLPWIILSCILYAVFNYINVESLFSGIGANPDTILSRYSSVGIISMATTQAGTVLALLIGMFSVANLVQGYFSLREKMRRTPTQEEVAEQYSRTFWRVLLAPIIGYGIAFLALGLIAGLLSVTLGFEVGVILGILLLGVGYMYVYPLRYSILCCIVEDNVSIFRAIQKVSRLSSGKWWWNFGIVFLVGLACGIAGFVFQIPTAVFTMMKSFAEINSEQSGSSSVIDVLFSLSTVFVAILALITTAIESLVGVVLYKRMEEIESGSNVQDLVSGLGQ